MSLTLKTGDLAYYDSPTAGLVPCKVVSVDGSPSGSLVMLKATAARGCFVRGESIVSPESRAVPRKAVYKRRGEYFPRILPYTVEVDHGR